MVQAAQVSLPRHHEVFFYDAGAQLAVAVAEYLRAGLSIGEPAVVVATTRHLAAIDSALAGAGVDVASARASGAYLTLDAVEALEAFMVDGSPDVDRLTSTFGPVFDAARGRVRVFGEMVAMLWGEGNIPGAIALESLWNDLAQDRQFSLLCAYPSTALRADALGEVNQVCHLHSAVRPPPNYGSVGAAPLPDVSAPAFGVFVAVPEAVGAARRLVRDVLASWDELPLVPDAALIMSELATNAIVHGGSAFRASIERASHVVRIAVEDVGPGLPQTPRLVLDAPGGRGVAIVEELSHRWGCDRNDVGKVIWVELVTSRV